jgi:hypothetical protein
MRNAGQGVLNILAIGGVKDHLDAALEPEQSSAPVARHAASPARVAL